MTSTTLEKKASLQALFHPKSVAVLGVSASDPNRYGNRVLAHLQASEYTGTAFAVGKNLVGPGAFNSVKQLPHPVDVVFLLVPAERTAREAAECAEIGAKVVVVGSAGYSETGSEAGRSFLAALNAVATETGLHVLGPACSGCYNVTDGISLGYNTTNGYQLRKGSIAVFGHSGAFMDPIPLMIQARGGGLSLLSSTGLEIDFSVLDMAEYAVEDGNTKVIALVLDSVADGPRMRRLADTARSVGKSIVVLEVGTSDRGAEVALAHSSRLAGDTRAYDAFFASCGIAVTRSLESFATSACLLARLGGCRGGLGVMLNSGAGAALFADQAAALSIEVPALAAGTLARLHAVKRFPYTMTPPLNPVDMGTIGSAREARDEVPAALSADPGVGVLVAAILSPEYDGGFRSFASSLKDGRTENGKPLIILAPCSLDEAMRSDFDRLGVPVIVDTEECMQGIASLLAVQRARSAGTQSDDQFGHAPPKRPGVGEQVGATERRMLSDVASLDWLAGFGIPTVPMRLCGDENSVRNAGLELGWPVVLKGVQAGAAHKTEHGLVHLDLSSTEQLLAAYRAVGGGQALVQRQVKADCEAIVGYVAHRDVGPMLIAGLGGVFVEELRDTAFCAVPASKEEVQELILGTALGRVLTSPRWQRGGAVDAVVDALWGLQKAGLTAGPDLSAIDVNPLVIGVDGVVAVDALVTFGEQG